jgi:hypothetical protein
MKKLKPHNPESDELDLVTVIAKTLREQTEVRQELLPYLIDQELDARIDRWITGFERGHEW